MRYDHEDAQTSGALSAEATVRVARNVATIADIPWEELSDGVARGCLLDMAYRGGNVGAFRAEDGHWRVCLGSRSESCADWAARFHV